MKHENIADCERCTQKLTLAHPGIANWFLWVKSFQIDCHISCSWRGEEEQNKAYAEKKSNAQWPKSPHNALNSDGYPSSIALDIFRLGSDGKAYFEKEFCELIYQKTKEANLPIIWGGNFKTIKGDYNHFELKRES